MAREREREREGGGVHNSSLLFVGLNKYLLEKRIGSVERSYMQPCIQSNAHVFLFKVYSVAFGWSVVKLV